MDYKTVEFPPVNAEEEAKLKRLFATMSEFMETDEIITETVMILRVKIPSTERALASAIKRLANAQKRKNKPAPKLLAK